MRSSSAFVLLVASLGVAAAINSEAVGVLQALYNATGGNERWDNSTNWNFAPDANPCDGTWYGITCTNGQISAINLEDNSLEGPIPSELASLFNLDRLRLQNNMLNGTIPMELGALTNLTKLDLDDNKLTGTIPTELGALTNLTKLDLHDNYLNGTIPTELGALTSLSYLDLDGNELTGTIPTELGTLTNLEALYLSSNPLVGSIPTELGDLVEMKYLWISDSVFPHITGSGISGPIPTELGELTNLTQLYLNDNKLTGAIPTSLSTLTSLTKLYLDDNALDGTIPTSLSTLTNLTKLDLHSNKLTGTIPTELRALTSLSYLDLDSNKLTGTIPTQLGTLTDLWALYLSSNPLVGSIPTELGDLVEMKYLWISDSVFPHITGSGISGPIPTELGDLTNLTQLYLNDNKLTGTIPTSLRNSTTLDLNVDNNDLNIDMDNNIDAVVVLQALYNATGGASWATSTNWNSDPDANPCDETWYGITCTDGQISAISLGNNALIGAIPTELGNLASLTTLDLHSNELTGTIPTELGALTSLEKLDLHSNELTGTIPTELGDLYYDDDDDSYLDSYLEKLDLHSNYLTGTIPTNLKNVEYLDLDLDNNLLDADSDHDGVPDYKDRCPFEGGFIHADGCPVDSDNDGVRDCVSDRTETGCHSTFDIDFFSCCNIEQDYCPYDTPQGATVYATSSEYADAHPDLFAPPPGNDDDFVIHTRRTTHEFGFPGCPFDSDYDDIFDGADLCPDTTQEELKLTKDPDNDAFLDDKGCVILPPDMWKPTYDESAAAVSTIDGNPRLDLLFYIDKDIYDIATARGYPKLADVQIMDVMCVDVLEGLNIPVTIENATVDALEGVVPYEVGLDFDTDQLLGSPIWIDEPNGVASISFCVKFSVLSYTNVTDVSTAKVVKFETIQTSIVFDTEQDLQVIGSKIKSSDAKETTKTAEVEYPLAACRCDEKDECPDSEIPALSQDESLKICIRFKPDNSNALPPDYIQMSDIKSFTCRQGSISIQPIVNFARQGVEGQLISVEAKNNKTDGSNYTADGRMLTITSDLLGDFYGPRELPVRCDGTVVYEFASPTASPTTNPFVDGGRRLLGQTVSFDSEQNTRRAAQDKADTGAVAESEFAVNIMLAKRVDGEQNMGIGVIAGVAVASVAVVVGVGAAGATVAAGGPKVVLAKVLSRVIPVEGQPLAQAAEAGAHVGDGDFVVDTGAVA